MSLDRQIREMLGTKPRRRKAASSFKLEKDPNEPIWRVTFLGTYIGYVKRGKGGYYATAHIEEGDVRNVGHYATKAAAVGAIQGARYAATPGSRLMFSGS